MSCAQYYSEIHLLAYPIEYIAGIDLYNAGEYHAAHDAWEERWMGPDPRQIEQPEIEPPVIRLIAFAGLPNS